MSTSMCALVTGASRGIGRGIACQLAQAGYDVMVNYAGNQAAAKETQEKIQQLGRRAEIIQANVANEADGRRMVDETIKAFGRFDLLVNNAGVAPKVRADLLDMSQDSYEYVMDTNLKGPFFLTQYAANKMIELRGQGAQQQARIVFVTSISAYTASINRGEYCLSKAGLSMAVKLFADRLAHEDILVYEIQPGVIATDMTSGVKEKYDKLISEGMSPQPRWGTPEDVGKAVSAIALGHFDFSTGSSIEVGGGFGIRRL
ncbi:MAG: 3-ketoacyl-ACP reductase [Candidatus Hinthialibacter antarcticus]|nr:3-ketoacyl-ACP reductase [Candidatus Hinthialibacter antarcticus]